MRKLTSILLILCLYSTWLGYHLLFHVQLSAVKSEMKTFLRNQKDHKDVKELSFSEKESDELEWEEETEFNYKGEMYDVVEKKMEGNRVIVRCVTDTKETSLLLDYQKNTRRNSSNSLIAQLIIAPCILQPENSLNRPVYFINTCLPQLSPILPTTISFVFSPPPDIC